MKHATELIQQFDGGAQSGIDREDLDNLFDKLLQVYAALPEDQRKTVRKEYNACKCWTADWFWARYPSYFLRFRDHGTVDDLRRALAHYSLSDGFPDARDAIVGISDLLVAAEKHDVDPRPVFAEIAAISNPDGTWSLKKYMLLKEDAADTESSAAASPSPSLDVYEPPRHDRRVVVEKPDATHIAQTVRSLPWSDITFVVLARDESNWCEFSGSYADGFSAVYADQGQEHVISEAPPSLDEGIRLLTLYLHDDQRWRVEYAWQ